jgi:hypothetical protein
MDVVDSGRLWRRRPMTGSVGQPVLPQGDDTVAAAAGGRSAREASPGAGDGALELPLQAAGRTGCGDLQGGQPPGMPSPGCAQRGWLGRRPAWPAHGGPRQAPMQRAVCFRLLQVPMGSSRASRPCGRCGRCWSTRSGLPPWRRRGAPSRSPTSAARGHRPHWRPRCRSSPPSHVSRRRLAASRPTRTSMGAVASAVTVSELRDCRHGNPPSSSCSRHTVCLRRFLLPS